MHILNILFQVVYDDRESEPERETDEGIAYLRCSIYLTFSERIDTSPTKSSRRGLRGAQNPAPPQTSSSQPTPGPKKRGRPSKKVAVVTPQTNNNKDETNESASQAAAGFEQAA